MELWAAVDTDGTTNIYRGAPEMKRSIGKWDSVDDCQLLEYQEVFSDLACRNVQPGKKRKLKIFDPINEIVEYEDTLEEKHQRLVDAVRNWHVPSFPNHADTELMNFLRSEGYIQ